MRRFVSVLPCVLVASALACHESHDVDALLDASAALPSDVPAPDGSVGGAAATTGAGAGGVGGDSAGGGTSAPPPPPPPPPPPVCVGCQDEPGTFFGDLPWCCTANGRCGLDTSPTGIPSCVERDAPGSADPACPNFVGSVVTLSGCCRYDGTCGVMFQQTPVGCANDPALFPMLGGPAPAPLPCGRVQ